MDGSPRSRISIHNFNSVNSNKAWLPTSSKTQRGASKEDELRKIKESKPVDDKELFNRLYKEAEQKTKQVEDRLKKSMIEQVKGCTFQPNKHKYKGIKVFDPNDDFE